MNNTMASNLREKFTRAEIVRILKYKREKSARRSNVDQDALTRVRRDLFGAANREESESTVQRELNQLSTEQQRRWSFDFDNEQPIVKNPYNNLNWMKVGGEGDDGEKTKDENVATIEGNQQEGEKKITTAQQPLLPATTSAGNSPTIGVFPQQFTSLAPPTAQLKPKPKVKVSPRLEKSRRNLRRLVRDDYLSIPPKKSTPKKNLNTPTTKLTDMLGIIKPSTVTETLTAKGVIMTEVPNQPISERNIN